MRNDPGVVVVGGGVAGIAAALNLSQRGVSVSLVERQPTLGGNAATVCCKAVGGKCQYCGGCLYADHFGRHQRRQARADPYPDYRGPGKAGQR